MGRPLTCFFVFLQRMKRLIWLIFLFTGYSYSQDILHVQASSGVVMPLGRIASNNVNDSSSGYTSTGGIVEFRMGVKPSKYIGIVFSGGLGMLPINTGSIQKNVFQQTGMNIKPVANNYKLAYASGGLLFSWRHPVKDRWILDASLTGGYVWAEMPDISVIESGIIYYKSYQSYGGGWMMSTNFSFRFRVYKSFYVGSGIEYMYARPKFTNLIVEDRFTGSNETRQSTFEQNMSLIYLSGQI